MVESLRHRTVRTTDGNIAFHRTGGSKPPLILLHGLTDNGLCWSRFAHAMADQYDVIMLDQRGHGRSDMPPFGSSVDAARDLTEFISALGLSNVCLMGHSIGALAASEFAAQRSDLLSKLILEDPPLKQQFGLGKPKSLTAFRDQVAAFKDMPIADIVAFGQKRHPSWHDDEFPQWATAKQQVDPDIAAALNFSPWRDLISEVKVPTLILSGAQGGLTTPDIGEEAQRINSMVTYHAVADAGHNVRRENFADFQCAAEGFLKAAVCHC